MQYDVVMDTGTSAAIEKVIDGEIVDTYLTVAFAGEGELPSGKGTFRFRSFPPHYGYLYGDPRGYKVRSRSFQGKTDIDIEIIASDLKDACDQFFTSFGNGDTFTITGVRLDQQTT
jgi:hypothetical protein